MGDFTIGVNIAGRQYKMTINPVNEEGVRKAAGLINEKVNEFASNYAFNDKQDLLAMVALQFTSEMMQLKGSKDQISKSSSIDDETLERLRNIELLLKVE